MFVANAERVYPSAKTLVSENVASRVFEKDASLYSFSQNAETFAENFMGWADVESLTHSRLCSLDEIQAFADKVVADGIKAAILIGQGGSTQAPMTITKFNKQSKFFAKDAAFGGNRIDFRTLDSASPVRVRQITGELPLKDTLVIVASKSGSTIEPRLMLRAVREILATVMPEEEVVKHLVAITDPGSAVEKQAQEEGWLAVFNGEPTVGGRFSALSPFGLVPAALAGVDIKEFVATAIDAEKVCADDAIDNPAIQLAAFLYDNYRDGRKTFSFFAPKRARVLGLWIEQLVAESTGKQGEGILPSIEVNPLLLSFDSGYRTVITYSVADDNWDRVQDFNLALGCIDSQIPRIDYHLRDVNDLAKHFVLWEYAIAMCGYLMRICPFDQPDVASAKAQVLEILKDGLPSPDFTEEVEGYPGFGSIEVRCNPDLCEAKDLQSVICALMESIEPHDYFAINAFIPLTGEGRREALEQLRDAIGQAFGVTTSLEIGPRYLHSTGQLQKGGPNNGVILLLSADELKDIPLAEEADSLGSLAKAQAVGDFMTLVARGRRCVHLHLPDNTATSLRILAELIESCVSEVVMSNLYDTFLSEVYEGEWDEEDLDDIGDYDEIEALDDFDELSEFDDELLMLAREDEIDLDDIDELEDELASEDEDDIDRGR